MNCFKTYIGLAVLVIAGLPSSSHAMSRFARPTGAASITRHLSPVALATTRVAARATLAASSARSISTVKPREEQAKKDALKVYKGTAAIKNSCRAITFLPFTCLTANLLDQNIDQVIGGFAGCITLPFPLLTLCMLDSFGAGPTALAVPICSAFATSLAGNITSSLVQTLSLQGTEKTKGPIQAALIKCHLKEIDLQKELERLQEDVDRNGSNCDPRGAKHASYTKKFHDIEQKFDDLEQNIQNLENIDKLFQEIRKRHWLKTNQ